MTREEREAAISYLETYRKSDEELFKMSPQNSVAHHAAAQCLKYWDMAIKALEQELKILDTIDFAIGASNGDTNYFVGFRNGLRYTKSLVDGKDPQFEHCAEQAPKKGHWVIRPHVYGVTYCSECDFELKINNTNFCPNCGADMRGKE